jgi:hypothetical protein
MYADMFICVHLRTLDCPLCVLCVSVVKIDEAYVGTVGYRAGNGGFKTFMQFTIDHTTEYRFTRPV